MIFWIFFDIVGGVFILYLIIGATHKKHSLDKNRVRSKAIVDDFFSIRYTDFFGYHFWVDGKEYQGSGWYYPESDTLSVGDTVIMIVPIPITTSWRGNILGNFPTTPLIGAGL